MATVNVRQLDENVVRRLKRRAEANNRSLESEVRHILAAAAENDMTVKRKSFLELSLKLREKTKGRVRIPSEVLIREDRESGYRDI